MNLLSYLLATETWHIRLLNRPVSTYELNGSTTASRSRPVMGMSEAWICCSSNKGRSQRSSRFRQLMTSYWRRSTLASDGLLTAQSSMPNTLTIEKLVAKHFTVSRQDNQLSSCLSVQHTHARTHTHTRLTTLCLGLSGWAGTRKAKPIWILLKQETVSGSGISWAICKSASRSRQITMPAPLH